jgi:hypothetical protein
MAQKRRLESAAYGNAVSDYLRRPKSLRHAAERLVVSLLLLCFLVAFSACSRKPAGPATAPADVLVAVRVTPAPFPIQRTTYMDLVITTTMPLPIVGLSALLKVILNYLFGLACRAGLTANPARAALR